MTDTINPFGDSPYIDDDTSTYNDTSKHGGDIRYKDSSILKYVIIAILIFTVLYILYNMSYKVRYNGEDYNQRLAHMHFDNLHGELYDDTAKQTIAYGEAIEQPRAIDHYRIGTTYLVNARDPRRAHAHFRRALEQIIDGVVDMKEAPFILDHIDDYKDQFMDFPEIEELPLQRALLAHFDAKQDMIKQVEEKKGEIKEDDPEFTQKILLSRQNWHSDSQNVHDSAIYNELKDQLTKVKNENALIPNIGVKDYNDVSNWLKIRYQNDPEKYDKILKVLSFYNYNYPIGSIPGVREQDLLVAVWQRAYDKGNEVNFNKIRESIGESILDCVEGGCVVCMSGRNSKTWQALANLDKNPDIGILKSKQMLRNEIFELSAKIIDDYVGKNGSASNSLKNAYMHGENTEQVKELTECIKKQIDDLGIKYENLLPKDQLEMTLKECKAVV